MTTSCRMQMQADVAAAFTAGPTMDCDPSMPAAESVPPTAVTGDVSSPTNQVWFVRMLGEHMLGLLLCT